MPSDGVAGVGAGATVDTRPGAVLFVCNRNSIRSPMAEAIARHIQADINGPRTFVDSAGIDPMMLNGFAIASLADWGIELERHVTQSLDDINFDEFDVVVSLAPDAQAFIERECDIGSAEHISWQLDDPNEQSGPNDLRRAAFDRTRDALRAHIAQLLSL